MKYFFKIFKGSCWINWAFILMVGGLAFISITTQLSGCGNKGDLILPTGSTSDKTSTTISTE